MDRNNFLAGIRHSLQAASLPPAQALPPDPEPEQLVATFTQEVENLSGQVFRVHSEAAALERIMAIFTAHQATDYLSWADEWLPYAGLNQKLTAGGYIRRDGFVPADAEARQETLDRLAAVPIGLTGAMAGLARSGSIVLTSGPGQGRLASLLPPVHICLLQVDRLFATVGHFIRAFPHSARQSSSLVFITGPSRTADIEQTLTLGVHGPGKLYLLLVS